MIFSSSSPHPSEAVILFRHWRKKEMATTKQPPDRDRAREDLDHCRNPGHQNDDKQPPDRDRAREDLDHCHDRSHEIDAKEPPLTVDHCSSAVAYTNNTKLSPFSHNKVPVSSIIFVSFKKETMATTSTNEVTPPISVSTYTDTVYNNNDNISTPSSKLPKKPIIKVSLPLPLAPSVLRPPSAKKGIALFSHPILEKKRIGDYAFVPRKQYLSLSSLVLLFLAFINVSHIAEAKSEINTLRQLNHNEKKSNYFER